MVVKTKIAHLTSHHSILDNRIFNRECRSLASAGYDVVLVAQHDHDEFRDGIQIRAVARHSSRLERVTLTAFRVFRRAWQERPAIFHFHDPELIPWGLLLRLLGKQVIYDVHEDFSQAAAVRSWLPGFARRLVADFSHFMDWLAHKTMWIVIAERYYERRFPGATAVLNYPDLEQSAALQAIERQPGLRPKQVRLLYTGSLTASRGALLHAELAHRLVGCEILMSGYCDPSVAERIRTCTGDATLGFIAPDGNIRWEKRSVRPAHEVSTVILEGVGFFVPPKTMIRHYRQEWTAGIAVFPYSEHYYEKELTKFFEYMAAGLPIVCSNFPTWRALVERPGAGMTVDPADWDAIVSAIRHLHQSPEKAVALGLAGRRAVQEQFSWQSQADSLVGLYARVLSRATPSGPTLGVAAAGNPKTPDSKRPSTTI